MVCGRGGCWDVGCRHDRYESLILEWGGYEDCITDSGIAVQHDRTGALTGYSFSMRHESGGVPVMLRGLTSSGDTAFQGRTELGLSADYRFWSETRNQGSADCVV
jgi:hypothetical protein